jgi:hemoglobin
MQLNDPTTQNMKTNVNRLESGNSKSRNALLLCLASVLMLAVGCGGGTVGEKKSSDFFTSGNREADQRASQRMAKAEQLSGSGEGAGQADVQKAKTTNSKSGSESETNKAAQVEGKLTLFDRLGGEEGLSKIVDDFTPRALQDPRVNWERKGVTRGGFSFHSGESVTWTNSPQNVAVLKKHMVQFLMLAAGGPAHYEGKEMKATHADMHITNPEFDAALGDLKASLDRLKIPNKEQKELLAIIESTRPQIVTER